VVYPGDRADPKKLDFPKGKSDEGETDVETAVREIGEEIGYNIRPHINESHYIRIETI
jgi:8-oxo-dGTP pyrophosphatase MutT (NUDIX family)